MEREPFLHRWHVPGMGLGTGGALRAERGCAMGCAARTGTDGLGFPSTDWKYNLHFYHSGVRLSSVSSPVWACPLRVQQ